MNKMVLEAKRAIIAYTFLAILLTGLFWGGIILLVNWVFSLW